MTIGEAEVIGKERVRNVKIVCNYVGGLDGLLLDERKAELADLRIKGRRENLSA